MYDLRLKKYSKHSLFHYTDTHYFRREILKTFGVYAAENFYPADYFKFLSPFFQKSFDNV